MALLKGSDEYKLWIERISKAKKGKKRPPFSQEWKDNMSRVKMGEKNNMFGKTGEKAPMWGITGEKHPMFGKHPSQETKEKLSKALSGEKNPMFGRTGEKHPMFGKHHSQESKDKMSQSHSGENNYWFGKKRPDITERNRQRTGEKGYTYGKKNPAVAERMKQRTGEKNPNWLGGISFEPYTSEFNKQLKELIRQRDGYKCQKCGCSEIENRTKLTCHHIDYDKKNCLPENLITLCIRCNVKVNTNRKKWTKYFQKKLAIGYQQKQLCLILN